MTSLAYRAGVVDGQLGVPSGDVGWSRFACAVWGNRAPSDMLEYKAAMNSFGAGRAAGQLKPIRRAPAP